MSKFSRILIFLGIICLLFTFLLIWQRYKPNNLAFATSQFSTAPDLRGRPLPTELIIKDIKLDLTIIPTRSKKGEWETTNQGVSWLSFSKYPGDAGNSILYGHNWPNLLGNITKLKPGQTIQIKYKGGSSLDFIITKTLTVSPNDTQVLGPSQEPIITLYTCSGFLDKMRFVIVARLKTN